MIDRAGVLAAAALAGLLFSPVFGFTAVILPVAIVTVAVFCSAEACLRRPARVRVSAAWRPVVMLAAGLVAVIVTMAGVPTGESLGVLADGAVHGWQLTLQSTWPVQPDPRLLMFVPLAVLLAGVFGIELLLRFRPPLLALLPSLVVAGLSQAYVAATGITATLAALGYAAIAAVLVVKNRSARVFALTVPAAVLGMIGALLVGADPPDRPAYSLKRDAAAPVDPVSVTSPLVRIAYRLQNPEVPVFRYTSGSRPDRWPLAVLDAFDGVNWTPGGTYRRMGTELVPGPGVTAPVTRHSATVDVLSTQTGPWLPSQTWPAAITGADPLVDEARGMLLAPVSAGNSRYTISWWEADPGDLAGAVIDPRAPGGSGNLGEIPPGVQDLAERAVGGLRPSFQTALALERYLRDNYRVAVGNDLPTGHSWPQLRRFLLEDKQGTSEQFAAAYVALARMRGIPARLVVGFRAPEPSADGNVVVRNGDVLAWPEVAVAGAGWVALDPTAAASRGSAARAGLARVTAQARAELPPTEQLRNPELPEGERDVGEPAAGPWDWPGLLQLAAIVLGLLLAGWVLGVPTATAVRAWRRRRGSGPTAVLGAWAEARDRLRAHGVPVTVGMTVRDLAVSARSFSQSTVDGLGALAVAVDSALWSGAGMSTALADEAWAAVRTVRKGLSRQPLRARMLAAVDGRVLRAPRN